MANKYDKQVWNKSYTTKELKQYRQKLARLVNKRMANISKTKSAITGEEFSEIGIMPITQEYLDIKGQDRFSTKLNVNLSYHDLRREIVVLENFLNAKSGTVNGIRSIEKQRISTFKSKGIGDFSTTKEFYDFLNSETFANLTNKYDSDKVVEMFELAHEKGVEDVDKVIDALEQHNNATKVGLKDMIKAINDIDIK